MRLVVEMAWLCRVRLAVESRQNEVVVESLWREAGDRAGGNTCFMFGEIFSSLELRSRFLYSCVLDFVVFYSFV